MTVAGLSRETQGALHHNKAQPQRWQRSHVKIGLQRDGCVQIHCVQIREGALFLSTALAIPHAESTISEMAAAV